MSTVAVPRISGPLPLTRPPRRRAHLGDILTLASVALWAEAMSQARVARMDTYGLVSVLPATYFAALLTLTLSFTLALRSERVSTLRMTAHVVLLVLFIHGTVPLLFAEPHYTWVYRHFGVIGYINTHGAVSQSVDIYQNWPGFFALVAWFSRASGLGDPVRFAAWAQVYFNVLFALGFGFVVSVLTPSVRKRWLAVFLFVAANWVASDYLAPQAFGFFLSLVIFGVVLRWLGTGSEARWLRRIEAQGQRLVRSRALAPFTGGWSTPRSEDGRVWGLVIVCGLFSVMVVSHQLSPYMVLVTLGLLTIAGLVRPRWLVLALAVIALAYLAPHFQYVNNTFGLLDNIGHPFRNAYPHMGLARGSPGRSFTADAARLLSIGIWALAGAGIVRRWRAGLWTAPLLLLVVSPVVLVLAQSYGGEAIYRVFLFALPWSSFLAVEAIAPRGEKWSRMASARVGISLAVVLALFVPSYFGLEDVYEVRPTEVAAASFFYAHAVPRSVPVLAAPNFPLRLDATYDQHLPAASAGDPLLLDAPALRGHALTQGDIGAIDAFVVSQQPNSVSVGGYVVISASMKAYWDEYGFQPADQLDVLSRLLATAPGWTTFYRNGDAVIYEFLANSSS